MRGSWPKVMRPPRPGASCTIVRNLHMVKGRKCRPIRCCRKMTGAPDVTRIRQAMTIQTGDDSSSPVPATSRSNVRFTKLVVAVISNEK